jgi:hypothetical protein
VLTGSRVPRIHHLPPGDRSLELVNDGLILLDAIGFVLDPWQQDVFTAALTQQPNGRWLCPHLACVVARQNGKGSILEALEIVCLVLLGEQILHTAHEFKTGIEGFTRLMSWFDNVESLRQLTKRVSRSHGEEGLELRNGGRVKFVARTLGSGRGFSADRVILDEAFHLPDKVLGALLPTLSAKPNPQIIYTSSAGMIDSTTLRSLRDRATTGDDPFLGYFGWEADPSLAPDDPEAWAQSNPALGFRIQADSIAQEVKVMPPPEFRRERLGIFDQAAGTVLRVLSVEAWEACWDRNAKPTEDLRFAVEVAQDRSMATIAVAGRWREFAAVDIVEQAAGTGWVVDRVIELLARYRRAKFAIDLKSPAAGLAPEFDMRGVPYESVATTDFVQACGRFFDLVQQGKLRHPGAGPLDMALNIAVTRPLGDAWAWDRKKSAGDISSLVAATIALGGAEPPKPKPRLIRL